MRDDIIKIFKEIEEEINSPEYIERSRIIQLQCEGIKKMPLNTKEDILRAKNASRPIPNSAEKVLLFKYLITIEDSLDR